MPQNPLSVVQTPAGDRSLVACPRGQDCGQYCLALSLTTCVMEWSAPSTSFTDDIKPGGLLDQVDRQDEETDREESCEVQ